MPPKGICKFYQKGHCRDGNRCRFQHVRDGAAAGDSNANQPHQHDPPSHESMLFNMLREDLKEKSPELPFLWPFSAYGLNFSSAHASVPSFLGRESSVEELRWMGIQMGVPGYVQAWNQAWLQAQTRKDAIWRNAADVIKLSSSNTTTSQQIEAALQQNSGSPFNQAQSASIGSLYNSSQSFAPSTSSYALPQASSSQHSIHSGPPQGTSQPLPFPVPSPSAPTHFPQQHQPPRPHQQYQSSAHSASSFAFGQIPEMPPE